MVPVKSGFSPAQTERVFAAAQHLVCPSSCMQSSYPIKAVQPLTARFRGPSADHLEYLSRRRHRGDARGWYGCRTFAGRVLLLCAKTKLPPIAALREAGVAMAVASDCNPGTSPMTSPLLSMNMALHFVSIDSIEALQGYNYSRCRESALVCRIKSVV